MPESLSTKSTHNEQAYFHFAAPFVRSTQAYPTSTHTATTQSRSPTLNCESTSVAASMQQLELPEASGTHEPSQLYPALSPRTPESSFALASAAVSHTTLLHAYPPQPSLQAASVFSSRRSNLGAAFIRLHTQAIIEKEEETRSKRDWLSAVFATGTGGGKLVAAVGAGSLGMYIANGISGESALGSALVTFGAIVAIAAALVAFGPYVQRNYPQNALSLKVVSIGAAALMIGGNIAAGYAGIQDISSLKIGGTSVYALGNAAMSVSFRNFVAISELERGRMFLCYRRQASWAMLAAGLVTLLVINVVRPNEEFPREMRAGLLIVAGAALCAGLAWPSRPFGPSLLRKNHNYIRQALCAVGIGATMGISGGDPSLPIDSHLKSLALTICSSPLFGALAVDESERLRLEIQALSATAPAHSGPV